MVTRFSFVGQYYAIPNYYDFGSLLPSIQLPNWHFFIVVDLPYYIVGRKLSTGGGFMIVTCNLKTRSSFFVKDAQKFFFLSRYNHLMKGFIVMMIQHFSLTSIRRYLRI